MKTATYYQPDEASKQLFIVGESDDKKKVDLSATEGGEAVVTSCPVWDGEGTQPFGTCTIDGIKPKAADAKEEKK